MKTAKLLIDQQCKLGEGPIWIPSHQRLYWVDILGHKIYSALEDGTSVLSYDFPTYVSNIYESTDSNTLIIALADGLYTWKVDQHQWEVLAKFEEEDPELRTNDGFCDPNGNLWIGTMALSEEEGLGDLWLLDEDKKWHKMLPHTSISNGIRCTESGEHIYYIDTPTHQVRKFTFSHENKSWVLDKVVFEIDPSVGHPDGMAIDVNGNLWIALWDGEAVICVDPESGQMIDQIKVPAPHVTACIFGGKNRNTLYITTAQKDMTEQELKAFPHAGGIFAITLDQEGRSNYKKAL